MLVVHKTGDCPSCGTKNSFGNSRVHGDHVQQGCTACQYTSMVWLSPIRKKVLYLDQCFFSSAFRGDSRFVEAVERVKRMANLQLLLVPYSSVHEDETHQWRGYKEFLQTDLLEFIKATARGAEFEKDYLVERNQVTKAWNAFLTGKKVYYEFEIEDAIVGSLEKWDDYFRVEVGGYFKDGELRRTLKTEAVNSLVNAFDEWRSATTTFEQDVGIEMRASGDKYFDSYVTMHNRFARGDVSAAINSPIIAKVVEYMLHWLPDEQSLIEKLKRCDAFFQSEHFNEVPLVWIEARMFATLKAMVKRGAYSNHDDAQRRLSGVFEDIKHIALYAPYCDAFFMDQSMADLVRQPTIGIEQRYEVKVFSLNNRSEFISWLDDLERSMTEEHKESFRAAYPDS
jgi:hypothetical protein